MSQSLINLANTPVVFNKLLINRFMEANIVNIMDFYLKPYVLHSSIYQYLIQLASSKDWTNYPHVKYIAQFNLTDIEDLAINDPNTWSLLKSCIEGFLRKLCTKYPNNLKFTTILSLIDKYNLALSHLNDFKFINNIKYYYKVGIDFRGRIYILNDKLNYQNNKLIRAFT